MAFRQEPFAPGLMDQSCVLLERGLQLQRNANVAAYEIDGVSGQTPFLEQGGD